MDQKTIFIQMAMAAWQTQLNRCTQLVDELTDEMWMNEIAPGKNRGIYLVGHLAAVHDSMSDILGTGKPQYPELRQIFLQMPDRQAEKIPSVADLRKVWTSVNARLASEFSAVPEAEWFNRHQAMSDEDFAKDPSRNKLNVLINRTNHLAYHLGQLRLLK